MGRARLAKVNGRAHDLAGLLLSTQVARMLDEPSLVAPQGSVEHAVERWLEFAIHPLKQMQDGYQFKVDAYLEAARAHGALACVRWDPALLGEAREVLKLIREVLPAALM